MPFLPWEVGLFEQACIRGVAPDFLTILIEQGGGTLFTSAAVNGVFLMHAPAPLPRQCSLERWRGQGRLGGSKVEEVDEFKIYYGGSLSEVVDRDEGNERKKNQE